MSGYGTRRDDMHVLDFPRLLTVMQRERQAMRTLFGMHEDLCLFSLADRSLAFGRDGERLESPVGVAAGPHTQLSQNIVASWLCGARWLELKTVQVRDDLEVPRPCIDMRDEGYNCEWSQELPLDLSFSQYADAWTAIRVLQLQAGLDPAAPPGFALDLSVGYDLAGIRSAPMQRFLDRADDPGVEITSRLQAAETFHRGSGDIPPPTRLAGSATLSTMHGCPADEIERIGRFLLEERGLHTAIKLNPTLLGVDAVRELVNGQLGYPVAVAVEAFAQDPDLATIVDFMRSLQGTAGRLGLRCGVKLTNTLPCVNPGGMLPGSEHTRYLSGRALHPVAVAAAARLQEACGGNLDISFAGGADALNVTPLLACGLGPVTVCSDLLRPGGYQRLRQYLEHIEAAVAAAGAHGPEALATRDGDAGPAAVLANLRDYAAASAADPRYHHAAYRDRSIRMPRPLAAFDCVAAPCVDACPTDQDVPGYMHHTARGDFAAALAVVRTDNAMPTTTGMVCDHPCQTKCTRVNYEAPVRIRDIKRFLTGRAAETQRPLATAATAAGRRVAVVGAGPAGLACARTLATAGVGVEIFEARASAGGMVTGVIPRFRLDPEHFAADLAHVEALGVRIRYGERIDAARFAALRDEFDAVFVAVGAQADATLGIPGEDLPGVVPALPFLARANAAPDQELDGEIAVVGGGDSAMDAARTAVRQTGDGRRVHLLYRRTERDMPADPEEIRAVRAEGVTIHTLRTPLAVAERNGRLRVTCAVMAPGAPDASGRPRPEPVPGSTEDFAVDMLIVAVGQHVDCDFMAGDLAAARADTAEGIDGVYLGGDARTGPASLVSALGDGRRAAEAMLRRFGVPVPASDRERPLPSEARRQDLAARLLAPHMPPVRRPAGRGDFSLAIGDLTPEEARAEAARCLECDLVCDVCVSVCPNRANFSWVMAPRRIPLVRILPTADGYTTEPDGDFVVAQARQTAHVADFCNHCGNCTTFCPTSGDPFLDKPRFALSTESWAADDDIHKLERDGDELRLRHRHRGREQTLIRRGDRLVWETDVARITLDPATFAVLDARFVAGAADVCDLRPAAALAVLLDGLAGDGGDSWLVT